HTQTRACRCPSCADDRRAGCVAPYLCVQHAISLLERLPPKWNPQNETPSPFRDFEAESQADVPDVTLVRDLLHNDPSSACFLPHVTLASVTDGFRVFTNAAAFATHRLPSIRAPDPDHFPSQVVVYTDGSCTQNGSLNACAGSGIWHSPNDARNIALRVPTALAQTSPVGELYAMQYNLSVSHRGLFCATLPTLA
ncbi:hypothetical protein BDZ89DRAFT_952551, partial [Hymenopellis radicata]